MVLTRIVNQPNSEIGFQKNNCKKYALLKCTSNYPADSSSLNLRTISDMRKKFKCEIGFVRSAWGIGANKKSPFISLSSSLKGVFALRGVAWGVGTRVAPRGVPKGST